MWTYEEICAAWINAENVVQKYSCASQISRFSCLGAFFTRTRYISQSNSHLFALHQIVYLRILGKSTKKCARQRRLTVVGRCQSERTGPFVTILSATDSSNAVGPASGYSEHGAGSVLRPSSTYTGGRSVAWN